MTLHHVYDVASAPTAFLVAVASSVCDMTLHHLYDVASPYVMCGDIMSRYVTVCHASHAVMLQMVMQ